MSVYKPKPQPLHCTSASLRRKLQRIAKAKRLGLLPNAGKA